MPNHRFFFLTLTALTLLVGCQNHDPTPPPAPELIGGPCKYDETPAIAMVSDTTGDQVRFLIDGQIVPYARPDLPAQFNYTPGMEFSVIEKRITQGTCTPYVLEVIGPAAGTRHQSESRQNVYTPPNPALK